MRFMTYLLLAILGTFAPTVGAATVFVDAPTTLRADQPTSGTCGPMSSLYPGMKGFNCLDGVLADIPLRGDVRLRDEQTQETWIGEQKLRLTTLCSSSYCKTDTGEYTGVNNTDRDWAGWVYFGWYVVIDGPHDVHTYQYGTGPYADNFPPYIIENTAQATPSSTQTTYDLWCNPKGDVCLYTDEQGTEYRLSREELPNYIPMADDTSDCFGETCVNAEMNVIGLNPDYGVWN